MSKPSWRWSAFLHRQAEILDEKRWEEWLALFTPDGHYWMPAREDQTDGEGVPNIFWENLDLMEMRIRRNNHPQAHSQAPNNRLCHVVSNVIIEDEAANGDIIARSRFHCAEYLRYDVRNFTGKYRHLLKRTDDGYRIRPAARGPCKPGGAIRICTSVVVVGLLTP